MYVAFEKSYKLHSQCFFFNKTCIVTIYDHGWNIYIYILCIQVCLILNLTISDCTKTYSRPKFIPGNGLEMNGKTQINSLVEILVTMLFISEVLVSSFSFIP